MVGSIPALKAYSGAVALIKRVIERELIRMVRALAMQTRREIDEAGFAPDDFEGIAQKYGITLRWAALSNNNPGCHIPKERKIVTTQPGDIIILMNVAFTEGLGKG